MYFHVPKKDQAYYDSVTYNFEVMNFVELYNSFVFMIQKENDQLRILSFFNLKLCIIILSAPVCSF